MQPGTIIPTAFCRYCNRQCYVPTEYKRKDMTDSTDNTNDLDSYGVWVKRPSKAASDGTNASDVTDKPADDFNMDADLPDFSEIDISSVASDLSEDTAGKLQDDTTLSAEELSDITGSIDMSDITQPGQEQSEPVPADQKTEKVTELSLDDFLDEGFSDTGTAAQRVEPAAENEPASVSEDSEDISLDDFLDTDFASSEEPVNQDKTPDETPLDIDLSFSSDEPADEKLSVSEEPEQESETYGAETQSSEPVDAGTFDDMFTSLSDTAPAAEPAQQSDDGTGTGTESESESLPDTENIELSDFGIDAEAEETPITTNIAETKQKSTAVDYTLSVTNDDNVEAAPVVSEIKQSSAANLVPDSFEEETSSLIGSPEEKRESAPVSSDTSTELLRQIVSDLSGLKAEISNLKNDFAELKAHEELSAAGTHTKQQEGGFFANEDEDETISLSGDELDNIMNTAAFSNTDKGVSETAAEENAVQEEAPLTAHTQEPAGEYEEFSELSEETPGTADDTVQTGTISETVSEPLDENLFRAIDAAAEVPESPAVEDTDSSDLTMNFDAEHLEEPNLDVLSDEAADTAIAEELPEEISIPKVDDILVESSASDFMESVKDTTSEIEEPLTAENTAEEPEPAEVFEPEEPLVPEDAVDLSVAAAEETEPAFEAPFEKETPETDETLSESETPEAEETLPESVFPTETSVSDSLTQDNIAYLNTDENAKIEIEPESSAESEEKKQSLPGDLTQEVKSVLLYMDQLLENLPEDKIIEFARSEHFATYKKLFSDLGLS